MPLSQCEHLSRSLHAGANVHDPRPRPAHQKERQASRTPARLPVAGSPAEMVFLPA